MCIVTRWRGPDVRFREIIERGWTSLHNADVIQRVEQFHLIKKAIFICSHFGKELNLD